MTVVSWCIFTISATHHRVQIVIPFIVDVFSVSHQHHLSLLLLAADTGHWSHMFNCTGREMILYSSDPRKREVHDRIHTRFDSWFRIFDCTKRFLNVVRMLRIQHVSETFVCMIVRSGPLGIALISEVFPTSCSKWLRTSWHAVNAHSSSTGFT